MAIRLRSSIVEGRTIARCASLYSFEVWAAYVYRAQLMRIEEGSRVELWRSIGCFESPEGCPRTTRIQGGCERLVADDEGEERETKGRNEKSMPCSEVEEQRRGKKGTQGRNVKPIEETLREGGRGMSLRRMARAWTANCLVDDERGSDGSQGLPSVVDALQ